MIRAGLANDVTAMRYMTLAALCGAALLAGCGDSDDEGGPVAAATATIAIEDFKYAPDPATVNAGQKISLPNADDAPHTLTDRAGRRAFDSGTIKGKATGSVTFDKAGTFSYFCEFHPYMQGTVTVED